MCCTVEITDIITPNIPEAEILSGCSITTEDDFDEIARKLSGNTGISVLLKAGHLNGDNLVDYFYDAEDGTMTKLPSKSVHTMNTLYIILSICCSSGKRGLTDCCCNISKEIHRTGNHLRRRL